MGIGNKTIAITGASGNLGGSLVEHILRNTDWELVTFSSRSLSQWTTNPRVHQYHNEDIGKILPSLDVDILVHFAFARRFRSNTDIATSLDFADRVYRSVYKNAKCRLVNISTVGVYAPSDDFIDKNAPIGPDSLYGMAKYASEVILKSVFMDSIERTTNLRLGGVAQSQRLIPVFIENAKNNHEISIVGGAQQFSWIDIDDAIEAIAATLQMESWQQVYNVTLNMERYTILDIAQKVADIAKDLGYGDVNITIKPQDIHLMVGWVSSRFINDSGWTPQVSIVDTIKKMF